MDIPNTLAGQDTCALFFGKIQVILGKGVLGIVAAANHAPAALDATGALRAGTPEDMGRGRSALQAQRKPPLR